MIENNNEEYTPNGAANSGVDIDALNIEDLDLSLEVSNEEKRALPFGVQQHLLRNNKEFTPENIQQAYVDIEEQGNKTFDDHVTDLKDAIIGNGIERFKNWSYNVFGPDGIGGIPGPSTAARFQQAAAAYALAMDKIKGTEESEAEAKKEFKDLADIQKMQKQMPSVVDDDSEGLLGTLAGLLGDTTQVAQSVIPTMGASIAGGLAGGAVAGAPGAAAGATTGAVASTAIQIAPSFITDYNQTKAEEKYKDEGLTGEEALNKLIEEDEVDMLVPLTGAAIAMIPEYVGFKGVSNYLLKSTAGKSVLSKVARLGLTSSKEGLTEVTQLFPEGVNTALAAGESIEDAVVEGLQYTFENSKDTFVSSTVGTAAFGLGGKGVKQGGARLWRKKRNLRAAIDEGKMEAIMEEISDLNVQRMEANEPELKEALTEKINDKVKELDALDVKANNIMSVASDQDFDEITELEDLKKKYINKVKDIQNKKETLDPKEYQQSLSIYKEKYLDAQARIKGIANKVKEQAEGKTDQDIDEATVKKANVVNSVKTFDDNNFNTKVAPNVTAMVQGVANRLFRSYKEFGEQAYTKADFVADIMYGTLRNPASSVRGLFDSFNPESGQLLSTYIARNIENRAKRILEERIGSQATEGGVSIDTTEAREVEETDVQEPTVQQGPNFAKRLGLDDAMIEKVRKAALKALSTAKDVDSKTFVTDLVNAVNNEIFEDIRNMVPKPKEREAFMKKFAGAIWDAMPQSSLAKATRNKTFQEWGMQAPTKEAFIDYFLGRDQEGLKANTINDRVKKQLPQYLSKALGAEFAADLLKNNPEARERFSLTQDAQVEEAAQSIVENDDSSWFDFKSFQESTEASEDDAAAQTKDWNKQIPGDDKTLVIDNKTNQEDKDLFKNWVKEVMTKYFPKEFFFINRSGHLHNSSSRFAFANQEDVDATLKDAKFAEDTSGINWSKVGRVKYANLGRKLQTYLVGKLKGQSKVDVTLKELKDNFKEIQEQGRENMKALKFAAQQFAKMYKDDPATARFIATWYKSASQNQDHLLRFAAPLRAYSKDLTQGMREEHTMPSSLVGKYLFNAIINDKVDSAFKNVEKNYFQVALAEPDDNKLKGDGFNYTSKMPVGWKFTDSTWARYFNDNVNNNNGGIDPNGIVFFETGKTVAETFGAQATNQTPDVIAAQQEVIKEKVEDPIETLIDRAIGKLEDYLGPKGALQANFAAVPINVLVGGLRATKLAYRGSKSLVEALNKGYEKVKDYMSKQDWLDFASKAVNEVKNEQTGAGVALAIANEKAIEREQQRQAKLDILKKVNEYKKSDEKKSSKELDEKLSELDKEIKAKNRTEGMERNFRRILNMKRKTGKRPSKWFIPSNAEDIKGLLYAFLPGGKLGVEAKEFFKSTILKPYSEGVAAAEAEILQLSKKFVELKDSLKNLNINENIEGTPYTMGDAIKVYNWIKQGVDVDILKKIYTDKLIAAVEANPEAKYMADQVAANFEIEYDKNWRGVPFNKSVYDAITKGTRTRHLETFAQNVDAIFNKDNMQEIENAFGKDFAQALQASLKRMKTGRNRVSTDAQSNKFLNWLNRAVATTMFVNTRSAALQLLSSLNYIGLPGNNIFQATKAFANQEQWRADYNKLWNSDYLTNRREGAKFDVLADEIAENQEGWLNNLLQKGFLPTRYADSFAIAMGGAAFYRNRVNDLVKNGMTQEQAEDQAMKDWIEASEETQQSSDPSKISEIQSSAVGKLIYAFANTPFQYARKSKRLLQDIVSGRSNAEGGMNQVRKDLQSVFYYTVGQAMLFNALQTALFAALFNDDDEELDEKTVTLIERTLTSYAKSLGNPGAVVASLYSVLAEANEQIEKRGKIDNPYKIALEATAISPPLNAKLKDLVAIGNIYKYNTKQIESDPFEFSINNPVLEIAGNAASFTGVPLDRVIRKAQNISAALNAETEAWEKLFLTMGWSEWELGIDLEDREIRSKYGLGDMKPKDMGIEGIQLEDLDIDLDSEFDFGDIELDDLDIESPAKKLERGVAGVANRDGTIEVDPNLSPVEREKTIAHEKQHVKDIEAGRLDYDDDYVYWNGGKHKRENGNIIYNGKAYVEGHKDLPWEKKAYAAEPSTQEIKKRKKLY